ncbi:MAG: ThiF family adenylyltransferase, partial [Candidatus Brocadiales bacterium]|nr:ThiF family adenylyltransferase [Candidatus Brocadiales bacterium]
GIQGEVFDSEGNKIMEVFSVKVIGKSGIKDFPCTETTVENTKDIDKEVFDRNMRWLGEEGQKKLAMTHLGICGVGGVGSYAALIASGLGFRKFTIIDGDAVEASNLNRLPGLGRRHIGVKKVEAVAEMLSSQSLGLEARLIGSWVQDKEARTALKEVDIVLSCVDNNRARLELQTLAVRYLKPLLDFGTEIHLDSQKDNVVASMGGQIRFYIPGGACLVCQGLDPARIKSPRQEDVERLTGYVRGKNETPPSVNIINAVAASLGLELLTRYITGFATPGFHERFDLIDFSFKKMSFTKRPECLVCGDDRAEGRGDLEEYNREPEKASFPEPFRTDRHIGYKTDIMNRIQQVILLLEAFLSKGK